MIFAILAIPMMYNTSSQTLNANAQQADFNIATAGDWGCNDRTEGTVDDMEGRSPELIIGLGDYSYADSVDCWLEIVVDPIDDKMQIAIGDHDDDRSSKLRDLVKHFDMSSQYYALSHENVRIIVMSTEVDYNAGSAQHSFVESELEDAAADPSIDWIIVAVHKQAYASPSSGTHTYATLTNVYHPMFDEHGVDLVLQAHAHLFERSYPIKYNPDSPRNPIRTDAAREFYSDPEGVIYATVGTAGASPKPDFDGRRSYIEDQYEGFGFLDIQIIDGGQTMRVRFYDDDGSAQDRFQITK
jgi:predicted phosphodiesterase